LKSLQNQIKKTLAIKGELVEESKDEAALLQLITLYVQELIDTDFEKLLQTLYRIDIPDYKVKEAVEQSAPGDAPRVIATLILEREKQKVATREKYKSKDEGDWIFEV
jgi:hypothetical protein